jgi:hypothetical protein
MQKRRSIRETKNMIQTALWLPRAMHEQLKKTGGDRGLGDEIRRRLQASFDEEQVDATTHELLDAIEQIERNLSLDEPWHTDRFTFEVFKAAINELLSHYQPSSEADAGTVSKLQTMYGPEEKPETIGRILARIAIVASGRDARLRASHEGASHEGASHTEVINLSKKSTPSSGEGVDLSEQIRQRKR